MAVAVVDVQVKGSGAVNELRNINNASRQAQAGITGLTGSITKLVGAFSAAAAAKFVFVSAAEIETQTRSLQVLTGSVQKATEIIRELQQLGAATPFTSAELIDAAKRLQAFGVATDKVVETTRRLADVSGATGAELQGLVTAYGQVQAKGRLQGEELLQFQERGVALQQVLKDEYKLTGQEFQKALEKGQISAQAVEYAIRKLTEAGGQYANGAIAQSDTLAGKFSTLQDSVQSLAARVGAVLTPALKGVLGVAIDIANQVNNVFETILLQRQLGGNLSTTQRNKLFAQAGKEAEDLARLRGGREGKINPAVFTQLREERFRDLMRTFGYQQGILTPPKPSIGATGGGLPALLSATAAGGAGATATKQVQKINDITKQELQLKLQLGIAQMQQNKEQEAYYTRQLALLDIEERKLGANEKEAEIFKVMVQYNNTMKQIQEDAANKTLPAMVEKISEAAEGYSKNLDLSIQITEQQRQQKELADGIANTVGTGLAGAFDALVQGTEDFGASLKKIASGVLIDIANQLLQIYVINQAINAISGLLGPKTGGFLSNIGFNKTAFGIPQLAGAKANGGSVMAGKGYLVGEKGPELFMPGKSGGIAPAGSFGGVGNIVVNVDATGSSVQGDQAQGKALGALVGAAVQAELIKQKKPGGLLY